MPLKHTSILRFFPHITREYRLDSMKRYNFIYYIVIQNEDRIFAAVFSPWAVFPEMTISEWNIG